MTAFLLGMFGGVVITLVVCRRYVRRLVRPSLKLEDMTPEQRADYIICQNIDRR
jgi:hypothetical protein